MRVYIEVAKRSFQQQLAYRAANFAGLATNAFWGALRSFLFLGLFQGGEVAAGWDVHDAIDYVWFTQAMIMPVYFWNWWEIANTIRTGGVVSDLAKPFDYYAFWLSRDVGRAIYHTLFRWLPTMLLGVLLFGVRLPGESGRWGWFFLSLTLAVWLSFGLRFLYNIAAFWLLDQRGVRALVSAVSRLLPPDDAGQHGGDGERSARHPDLVQLLRGTGRLAGWRGRTALWLGHGRVWAERDGGRRI
jgi:ABC-2 type transport system permease protein